MTPRTHWQPWHPYANVVPPPKKRETITVFDVRRAVEEHPGLNKYELRDLMQVPGAIPRETFASVITRAQQRGLVRSIRRSVKHKNAPGAVMMSYWYPTEKTI